MIFAGFVKYLYLYADDASFFGQHKDVTQFKMFWIKNLQIFGNNKLSFHFGEDKTRCTLFSNDKNLPEVNITYDNNRIKQYHMVEYLVCCLDANLSG